jgi:transcription elongation factor S-II
MFAKKKVDACDPFRVAVTVESALFERLGRPTGTQKAKYRSIMFNLRAENNTDFRRRVLIGEVMASDARKQENMHIKEKALFDCERGAAPKATRISSSVADVASGRQLTISCRLGVLMNR